MSNGAPALWLASRSPRRRELLAQIGVSFALLEVDVEEQPGESESPADYNLRVAQDKAVAGAGQRPSAMPVLGADTEVALDGRIYGKPADAAEAREMLQSLAGRTHRVYSSVAVVNEAGEARSCQQVSEVTFAELDLRQINAYLTTGEYAGRAGGYAIQGLGSSFVAHIEGSYSGVMGLPLFETVPLLQWAGALKPDSPLRL
ncbi:MAG: Maf family protein [Pseudomonadota bacterium]